MTPKSPNAKTISQIVDFFTAAFELVVAGAELIPAPISVGVSCTLGGITVRISTHAIPEGWAAGGSGIAAGTMIKPESKSISSSASGRPAIMFSRFTLNIPPLPRSGLTPTIYAKITSDTRQAIHLHKTAADSRRVGAISPKKDSSTLDALMPKIGGSS